MNTNIMPSAESERDNLSAPSSRTSLASTQRSACPPIDFRVLYQQCLGSLEFMSVLMNELEATTDSRLQSLCLAATNADLAAVAVSAHSLKGVAGILAANPLMSACIDLELALPGNDLVHVRDLARQVESEMRRAVEYIPVIKAMASSRHKACSTEVDAVNFAIAE